MEVAVKIPGFCDKERTDSSNGDLGMVWSREREAERPPLSVILPRLYLGAESDVTQERLTSLGISYVLSVSRCSPQPSFLPHSRYLRIPIDDSLWDDLLPWIPQALQFIDAALSMGASVLVHCSAGISRSPALAVAYIMYSLGMDLDHAYRFVKERRPSISPNFNFLGQLQHFQSTLSQKTSDAGLLFQQLDNHLSPTNTKVKHIHTLQSTLCQANRLNSDSAEVKQANTEKYNHTNQTLHRHLPADGSGNGQTSNLILHQNQQHWQLLSDIPAPAPPVKTAAQPSQLPVGSASFLEKRKSLTLSLTPLEFRESHATNRSEQANSITTTSVLSDRSEVKTSSDPCTHRQAKDSHMEQNLCQSRTQAKEQGLLSPLSVTLNKLLCWGERMLLERLFIHPVRMGQTSLPYRW
ncbi:uncharacterized protein V6R79_010604 [Siganus canaliculatus]